MMQERLRLSMLFITHHTIWLTCAHLIATSSRCRPTSFMDRISASCTAKTNYSRRSTSLGSFLPLTMLLKMQRPERKIRKEWLAPRQQLIFLLRLVVKERDVNDSRRLSTKHMSETCNSLESCGMD